MVIFSVLLTGLAAALLSNYLLHRRRKQIQRSSIRERFHTKTPTPGKGSRQGCSGVATAGTDETPGKGSRQLYQKIPLIGRALKRREVRRVAHHCEAELPRMLDILAMGMHAGLSFDAAFGLYAHRFESELALLCRERFEIWERGLISRSEGLEQLAATIQVPIFDRFCRTASRSIRYGIPMAPLIKEYAEQARKEYRNKQKELVLKAPVKMLIPTGVLILPAMLMLVIGPIVLDVAGRMV